MRNPEDEALTRAQVEEIVARGKGLTPWEQKFIDRQHRKMQVTPWFFDTEAAKIEQIWKERVR